MMSGYAAGFFAAAGAYALMGSQGWRAMMMLAGLPRARGVVHPAFRAGTARDQCPPRFAAPAKGRGHQHRS